MDQSRLAGIRMMKNYDEAVFSLVNKDELLELLKEHDPNAYRKLGLIIQNMIGVQK
ncbi:hypothetical protein D3C85_1878400 [compost metagenome]